MMKSIIYILTLTFYLVSCSPYDGSGSTNGSKETYDEKVTSIEEIEVGQPSKFLSANATYRKNLIGTKIKINGTISNRATVATYKDVIIRVRYYSMTQTELYNEDYTVYKFFPPNSVVDFDLKITNFKDVESIGLEVVSASNK